MTRDMGPVTRCLGNDTAVVLPFQYPLPAALPPSQLANFDEASCYLRRGL